MLRPSADPRTSKFDIFLTSACVTFEFAEPFFAEKRLEGAPRTAHQVRSLVSMQKVCICSACLKTQKLLLGRQDFRPGTTGFAEVATTLPVEICIQSLSSGDVNEKAF